MSNTMISSKFTYQYYLNWGISLHFFRTPGDFGKVICSAHNLAGEGKSCEYIIKQRVSYIYSIFIQLTSRPVLVITVSD